MLKFTAKFVAVLTALFCFIYFVIGIEITFPAPNYELLYLSDLDNPSVMEDEDFLNIVLVEETNFEGQEVPEFRYQVEVVSCSGSKMQVNINKRLNYDAMVDFPVGLRIDSDTRLNFEIEQHYHSVEEFVQETKTNELKELI